MNKESFHRNGKSLLKKIAGDLALKEGEFEIVSNKGGPAVMGEITLHGKEIYVQIFDRGIMYRTVSGPKDYCGGPNYYFTPLDSTEKIVKTLKNLLTPN